MEYINHDCAKNREVSVLDQMRRIMDVAMSHCVLITNGAFPSIRHCPGEDYHDAEFYIFNAPGKYVCYLFTKAGESWEQQVLNGDCIDTIVAKINNVPAMGPFKEELVAIMNRQISTTINAGLKRYEVHGIRIGNLRYNKKDPCFGLYHLNSGKYVSTDHDTYLNVHENLDALMYAYRDTDVVDKVLFAADWLKQADIIVLK